MHVLGRLLLGSFALILAVPAGALVLLVGALSDPGLRDLAAALGFVGIGTILDGVTSGLPDATALALMHAAAFALFLLAAVPPSLAALTGEIFGARSFVWYGGASGVVEAALPWLARSGFGSLRDASSLAAEGRITALLFVAGAVAGLVYWAVAGRSAGYGMSVPKRPPSGR